MIGLWRQTRRAVPSTAPRGSSAEPVSAAWARMTVLGATASHLRCQQHRHLASVRKTALKTLEKRSERSAAFEYGVKAIREKHQAAHSFSDEGCANRRPELQQSEAQRHPEIVPTSRRIKAERRNFTSMPAILRGRIVAARSQ